MAAGVKQDHKERIQALLAEGKSTNAIATDLGVSWKKADELIKKFNPGIESGDVGRPLKFGSPEELQKKIDAYFESCEEEIWVQETDEEGNEKWIPILDRHGMVKKQLVKPYTISGLAVFLGTDRKTLINYEEREEYFHTIKAAKARIENFTEETLLTTRNPTGVIFNLKNNYGWIDKQEQKIEATVDKKLEEFFT